MKEKKESAFSTTLFFTLIVVLLQKSYEKAPDFKSSNTKTPHANNHLTHENFHSTPYSFKSLTNELKSTFCTKIKPVANNNVKADSTEV